MKMITFHYSPSAHQYVVNVKKIRHLNISICLQILVLNFHAKETPCQKGKYD